MTDYHDFGLGEGGPMGTDKMAKCLLHSKMKIEGNVFLDGPNTQGIVLAGCTCGEVKPQRNATVGDGISYSTMDGSLRWFVRIPFFGFSFLIGLGKDKSNP